MSASLDKASGELETLLSFFRKLQKDKNYGTITIQIKEGQIVLIRHESTIKIEDLSSYAK